jgi:hypothetical protein
LPRTGSGTVGATLHGKRTRERKGGLLKEEPSLQPALKNVPLLALPQNTTKYMRDVRLGFRPEEEPFGIHSLIGASNTTNKEGGLGFEN